MSTEFLILAAAAVIIGGFIKGISGFGYAVVSTSLLASLFNPADAVAFMILPLIAIQLELLNNLDREEIKTCTNNFKPYTLGITAGTILGFYSLSLVPTDTIKLVLGVLTFVFALSRTGRFSLGIEKLQRKCFRRSGKVQIPLGVASGIIFGGTNIGVQVVAYLKTMDMPNRKFVGLLALVMIPVSALRLPLVINQAGAAELIAYSVLVAPLSIISAYLGRKIAKYISEPRIEQITVSLLFLIAANLVGSVVL